MQQYKCIVIEDEPLAAEVLADYIRQVPFLNLTATCLDAIYATEVLRENQIDLLFLDIHLPKLKGIDFLKTIANPPRIIITTAYNEYAVNGYEYNVMDYLLKPIEFSRFLAAVNKITSYTNKPQQPKGDDYLFFNVNKKKIRIFLRDILYVESMKEYVRVVAKEKTIITKLQLGQVDDILPKDKFIRIHRSYIVAKDKIEAFTATDVELNNISIPIGRAFREYVVATLERSLIDK